mgnify:FL=1
MIQDLGFWFQCRKYGPRSLASADFAVAVFTYAEIQRIAYIFFVIKSVQVRNQHKQNTYKCFWFHSREFSLCGFFPLKKPRNLRNSWCREKCLDDQNERCSESRIYHAFNNWLKSVLKSHSHCHESAFSQNILCFYIFFGAKRNFLVKWKDEKIKYDFITNTAMMWVLGMLGGVQKLRWQDKVGEWYWKCHWYADFPLHIMIKKLRHKCKQGVGRGSSIGK